MVELTDSIQKLLGALPLAANVGRGVKITSPKGNGYVLKIAAQKNKDSKLKNGQHADTATNAALACFSFYKRLTSTNE